MELHTRLHDWLEDLVKPPFIGRFFTHLRIDFISFSFINGIKEIVGSPSKFSLGCEDLIQNHANGFAVAHPPIML